MNKTIILHAAINLHLQDNAHFDGVRHQTFAYTRLITLQIMLNRYVLL